MNRPPLQNADDGAADHDEQVVDGATHDDVAELLRWFEQPRELRVDVRTDLLARADAAREADALLPVENPQRGQALRAGAVTAVPTEAPARTGFQAPGAPTCPGDRLMRRRAVRARLGPLAIGTAARVILTLVGVGLLAALVVKARDDTTTADRDAAAVSPAHSATPAPVTSGPSVAVIGDGVVTRAATGVSADDRWPALLQSAISGTVTRFAAEGRGYVTVGAGSTFAAQAAKVPASADVVLFFGGAADADVSALSLAKAATTAIAAATERAPEARIVVIGPAFAAGASSADLSRIANTLRSAASITNAGWVDPIDAEWLRADVRDASSASSLTEADERTIAAKMGAVVAKAVG